MKHILLTLFLATCSIAASAQIPKFFGVPVDGTPETFTNALRDKGLKLELLSEEDGQRIYHVRNYFMPTNIAVKYGNGITNLVMMVAVPENDSSVANVFEYYINMMKEDNGDEGCTGSEGDRMMAVYKTMNNGQAAVVVSFPGPKSPDYTVTYMVENFDNSRKAVE